MSYCVYGQMSEIKNYYYYYYYYYYYVNRPTTTKVESTYLAVNQQCITYMCCGRARTLDHLIGGQAPYPIAQPRRQLLHLCAATSY